MARLGICQEILMRGSAPVDEIRVQVQVGPNRWVPLLCWFPTTRERAVMYLQTLPLCMWRTRETSMGSFQLFDFLQDPRIKSQFRWADSFSMDEMLETVMSCDPESDFFRILQSYFSKPWVIMGFCGAASTLETPSFVVDEEEWSIEASGTTLFEGLGSLRRRDPSVQWGFHTSEGQHIAGPTWQVHQ